MQKARKKGKVQRKNRQDYDSNRSFNKEPRGGRPHYCLCDMYYVSDVGRCPNCGRDGKSRYKNKKPYPLGD